MSATPPSRRRTVSLDHRRGVHCRFRPEPAGQPGGGRLPVPEGEVRCPVVAGRTRRRRGRAHQDGQRRADAAPGGLLLARGGRPGLPEFHGQQAALRPAPAACRAEKHGLRRDAPARRLPGRRSEDVPEQSIGTTALPAGARFRQPAVSRARIAGDPPPRSDPRRRDRCREPPHRADPGPAGTGTPDDRVQRGAVRAVPGRIDRLLPAHSLRSGRGRDRPAHHLIFHRAIRPPTAGPPHQPAHAGDRCRARADPGQYRRDPREARQSAARSKPGPDGGAGCQPAHHRVVPCPGTLLTKASGGRARA